MREGDGAYVLCTSRSECTTSFENSGACRDDVVDDDIGCGGIELHRAPHGIDDVGETIGTLEVRLGEGE